MPQTEDGANVLHPPRTKTKGYIKMHIKNIFKRLASALPDQQPTTTRTEHLI